MAEYIHMGSTTNVAPTAPAAPVEGTPPFPNVLHQYSSYSYVLTLSAISTEYCNSAAYRAGVKQNDGNLEIICRSGSGFPDNRQDTLAGKFEFFIDDLKISSAAGMDSMTKNTNATGISFTVTEPYSMGLFYQSLSVAATKCKHESFILSPYLLTIEFMGHISADKLNVKVPNSTKYISMRISKVEMSVTGAGAVYTIEAYPWNEQAYNKNHTEFTTDISVKGSNVKEMLVLGAPGEVAKDLQSIVNQRFRRFAEKNGDPTPDTIVILLPPDSSGDEDSPLNEIAEASMGFDTVRTAPSGMGKEDRIFDRATSTFLRSNLVTNPTVGEFNFSQGSDIINAINQIVLMSDYGRKALENVDQSGMVNWWKVETEYRQINPPAGAEDIYRKSDGSFPMVIVFKVIPYKVHISHFTPPNTKLVGKDNLEMQALKEYNYIYTGKNVDILDFQIRFDHGFYSPVSPDTTLESSDLKTGAQSSNSASPKPALDKAVFKPGDPKKTEMASRLVRSKTRSSLAYGGGGGLDDAASLAARNFFDVVTNPASLVQLDMTILGDPYFLGDSGLGNYSARSTQYSNMNSDGAVNWQNGEVDIKVTFETPVDPDLITGMYKFPSGDAENLVINQVSGLYKVYTLESNFKQGKFTQTLSLTRRSHQFSENNEGEPITKGTVNNQAARNS